MKKKPYYAHTDPNHPDLMPEQGARWQRLENCLKIPQGWEKYFYTQ